jgi:hypothetical protein
MARIVFCIYELIEDGRLRRVERWDGYDSTERILTGDYDTPQDAAAAIEAEQLTRDNLHIAMEVRP